MVWIVTLRRRRTGSSITLKRKGYKLEVICLLKKEYPGWQIAPSDVKEINEK